MRLLEVAGLSDPGRVRRRNEDAYVCEPPLFAVADGMGGAQAGEIASRLAAAAFREYHEADALAAEARLRSIIQEANRRIYARAATDPQVAGMGTTVTAALLADDRVAVGHVGDSRAYRLREGRLEQLTDDHSLVADLVRSGRLTPEQAETHPQRSVITRALGTDPAVAVDSFSVDARPGDTFLLCSDGLTTMVDEETVLATLSSAGDLKEAARLLVAAANRGGGDDNITVVLFTLGEDEALKDAEAEADEDTLSGREGLRLPASALQEPMSATLQAQPATLVEETQPSEGGTAPRASAGWPRPAAAPRVSRAVLIVALVALLFAGVVAAALFGLSRAHFVGANSEGRVAVYQGVPWDLVGDVKLYREIYVSPLLAAQLSPQERRRLFDHSLLSESEARARVLRYEEEAAP